MHRWLQRRSIALQGGRSRSTAAGRKCFNFKQAKLLGCGQTLLPIRQPLQVHVKRFSLRPGTRFGASPAVWSCTKHCFLHFSEALSWPGMGFERLFFFSACLKDTVDVWWCTPPALALEKVQIWATFTLAGVASLSPSLRVSCLDLSPARSTFKMNNPSHAGGKLLVWIKCENGATSVCLQVRVPREWSSRQTACVMRWMGFMFRHWAFARTTAVDSVHHKSAPFTEPQRNQSLVHLLSFFYSPHLKKKKPRLLQVSCQWWRSRRAELIAARRCPWSTSVLVIRAEQLSSRKLFRS